MTNLALAKPEGASLEVSDKNLYESLALRGDLSGLKPEEKAAYYQGLCKNLGLDPATQPFIPLKLNGKEILYASRGCTDQLARLHNVNRRIISEEEKHGVYIVTVEASLPNGRTEQSKGAVPIEGLKGADYCNALLKCETKAKRRATLSILGLGMLDESEIETIPRKAFEPENETATARSLADLVTAKQLGMIRAIARELGLDADEECQTVMNCRTDELSVRAASSLIQHLQDLQKITPVEPPPCSTPQNSDTAVGVDPDKPTRDLKDEISALFIGAGVEKKTLDDALAFIDNAPAARHPELLRRARLSAIKTVFANQDWEPDSVQTFLDEFGVAELEKATDEAIEAMIADMRVNKLIVLAPF